MTDKNWILLLIILIAVYFVLAEKFSRKSYPVHPQIPWVPPKKETQPVKRNKIHVTVIHPNGSTTSTYFPIKVRNGEDEITIDYKNL